MGLFGSSGSSSVTSAAVQSVAETVIETKPKNPDEGKGTSKIVDIIILVVIGGLLFFFVLWPLLICYACIFAAWLIMWPIMKFIPACGNHHWAAPAYRVLTVCALSPVKLCKTLYNQWKGGRAEGEAKIAEQKKAEAAKKPTDAPAPVVVDKV